MNREDFSEGELVVYTVCDEPNIPCKLGVIKRLEEDQAFVYYHEGATAAGTGYEHLHKLENAFVIKEHLINSLD